MLVVSLVLDVGAWSFGGSALNFVRGRFHFSIHLPPPPATANPLRLASSSARKGSSPQKIGAKALFYPDRKIKGTLGGGCLEAEAQRMALAALKTGKPETFELVLDHD